MKNFTLIILCTVLTQLLLAQTPTVEWVQDAWVPQAAVAKDVATDNSGNVYVIGEYTGTNIEFSPTVILNNAGGQDIFIAKYNSEGVVQWALNAGGAQDQYALSILCDGINIFISGHSNYATNIGGYFIESQSLFIVKMDGNGNIAFEPIKFYKLLNWYSNISCDDMGNLVVLIQAYANIQGVYLFSSDGTQLWHKNYALPFIDDRVSMIDPNNICLAGSFTSNFTLGSSTLTNNGGSDIYIAKLGPNGNVEWAKNPVGYADETLIGLRANIDGGVSLVGTTISSQLSFNSLVNLSNSGGKDIFVATYNAAGIAQSAEGTTWGDDKTISSAYINNVNNNVYLSGFFSSADVSIGNTPLSHFGGKDLFYAKFDNNLTNIWAKSAGGVNDDECLGITTYNDTITYIAGYYSGNAYFDIHDLSSLGTHSMFLGKIGGNIIENPCYVVGNIYNDENDNCIQEVGEEGLYGMFVSTESGSNYTMTQPDGSYILELEHGTHTIKQIIPMKSGYFITQKCPIGSQGHSVTFNLQGQIINNIDFANEVIECPMLWVDIASNQRRYCSENITVINYKNLGASPASNVNIEVEFPEFVDPISSTVPWSSIDGKVYTFEIGTLGSFSEGSFTITDKVSCDGEDIVDLTQCTEARIFPKNTCINPSQYWNKASLEVEGYCRENGKVQFTVTNVGEGSMTDSTEMRIYYDDALGYFSNIHLTSGKEFITSSVASNGMTIRLEVDQVPFHPDNRMVYAFVEGCDDGNSTISTGFVNQFPTLTENYEEAVSCLPIINSADPNDKLANPIGITDDHYIAKENNIEYMIRFQNTGTAPALKVVILDTLSPHLDISTFIEGASSHTYQLEVTGNEQPVLIWTFNDINLPDSTTNNLESQGFVKFFITPKNNTSLGTIIKNKASIYFDFNEPIITNKTFHEIAEPPFLVDYSLGHDIEIIYGINENTYLNNHSVEIYPNPATDNLTVHFKFNETCSGKMKLIDVFGSIVKAKSFEKKYGEVEYNFSVSDLPSGIYLLTILTDNELFTLKVITE